MKHKSAHLTGKIVEWDSTKGFGYLEADNQRFFLRWREMIDLRRQPTVGDWVRFVGLRDSKGRPFARQARLARNAKWFCRRALDLTVSAGILAACLLLPIVVWFHYFHASPMLLIAFVSVNLLTFWCYLIDKKRAERGEWPVAKRWLHLLELAGGWPAGWLAQRWLRHKCNQPGYQAVFWLIVAAHQVAAIGCLTNWAWPQSLPAVLGFG
jgi:uncharacterized membrane protein YsdA (DUF1294 family)/cold shock CspA family protein